MKLKPRDDPAVISFRLIPPHRKLVHESGWALDSVENRHHLLLALFAGIKTRDSDFHMEGRPSMLPCFTVSDVNLS